MHELDILLAFNAAVNFREAILKCREDLLLSTLINFPMGSCGDASLLLGKYLKDIGLGDFDCWRGRLGEKSHTWLQQNNLIIDITPDQFAGMNSNVIVSSKSLFHKSFNGKRKHPADFHIFENNVSSELESAYFKICKHLHKR